MVDRRPQDRDAREPRGDTFISHLSDRIAVVVLRNSEDATGQWLTERRNPDEDFRRAFDRDPEEISAVGLMADTDQLGARAEVWLRDVRWEWAESVDPHSSVRAGCISSC